MIRSPALLFGLILGLASTSPALAQSGGDWGLAVGAGTDNRSKNASKSAGEPFAWGEAVWESDSGFFYGGPAFETIRSSTGSNLEVSLNAGMRPQIAGFDLDLNVKRQWHVDAAPGADGDAWEFTADLSRSIGPATAGLELQHSPDGTGAVRAWTWVEGRVEWAFSPRLTGSVTAGRRTQDNAPDYHGWSVGAVWRVNRQIDIELRYHDIDADGPGAQYRDALVLEAGFRF